MEIHVSPYACIDGEGLENIAFKKRGSFKIAPHLLWHGALVFVVPSKILLHYIALYDKQRVLRTQFNLDPYGILRTESPQRFCE